MKRIIALTTLLALGLTACGSSNITVATPEELEAYPDQAGVIEAWQMLVDSAAEGDCETFQSYARSTVGMEEGECSEAFEYMLDAPAIDWSRTQWDANKGKAKIYELDKGDLVSFILNEADGVWGFTSDFWTN